MNNGESHQSFEFGNMIVCIMQHIAARFSFSRGGRKQATRGESGGGAEGTAR